MQFRALRPQSVRYSLRDAREACSCCLVSLQPASPRTGEPRFVREESAKRSSYRSTRLSSIDALPHMPAFGIGICQAACEAFASRGVEDGIALQRIN